MPTFEILHQQPSNCRVMDLSCVTHKCGVFIYIGFRGPNRKRIRKHVRNTTGGASAAAKCVASTIIPASLLCAPREPLSFRPLLIHARGTRRWRTHLTTSQIHLVRRVSSYIIPLEYFPCRGCRVLRKCEAVLSSRRLPRDPHRHNPRYSEYATQIHSHSVAT